MLFYDILGIILNIWHWIRSGRWSKLIIQCWNYYFKFIVFLLLSYIFPLEINRQVLKNSIFKSLCPVKIKFVWFMCFTFFNFHEYYFHAYHFYNYWLISFLTFCFTKNSFSLMIWSISCFRLLSTFLFKSRQVLLGSAIIKSFLVNNPHFHYYYGLNKLS